LAQGRLAGDRHLEAFGLFLLNALHFFLESGEGRPGAVDRGVVEDRFGKNETAGAGPGAGTLEIEYAYPVDPALLVVGQRGGGVSKLGEQPDKLGLAGIAASGLTVRDQAGDAPQAGIAGKQGQKRFLAVQLVEEGRKLVRSQVKQAIIAEKL
jgi:hypothetical protein